MKHILVIFCLSALQSLAQPSELFGNIWVLQRVTSAGVDYFPGAFYADHQFFEEYTMITHPYCGETGNFNAQYIGNNIMNLTYGGGLLGTCGILPEIYQKHYSIFHGPTGEGNNPLTYTIVPYEITYLLTITNLNGDSAYYVMQELNIQDFGSEGISAYPNPTTNRLFISGFEVGMNIHIFDINGRTISVEINRLENDHVVDLTNLSKGFYIISIESGSKKHKTLKILKL